ncbi:MAG: thiamine-phosphate kinase [Hyphomicrobiales bacterium]|nr:thiamine-phosphate kinase [Alphaproteobacteria bacterium]
MISRHFKPIAMHPGALGLTDDAAILTPPRGHSLVVTADAVVGGVHFFAGDPPGAIARKALRVNLSDLAAKGAKPAGFVLTLALPKSCGETWLKGFARGLGADAKRFQCPLLGGDTVYTPGPVTISITAFGTVPSGFMARRSGARAGDRVVVTGTIGDSALGLNLRKERGAAARWKLDRAMQRHLLARYLVPQPRNALAEALRLNASAAMDVSDGLAGDLGKLCRASGAGAEIEAARVPLSKAARAVLAADAEAMETVLTGGDDFEVVATVPQRKLKRFFAAARRAGVKVTEIGRVTAGTGARFLGADGRRLVFARASFSHF